MRKIKMWILALPVALLLGSPANAQSAVPATGLSLLSQLNANGPLAVPLMIEEGGLAAAASKGSTPGISFLFYTPSRTGTSLSAALSTTSSYGFSNHLQLARTSRPDTSGLSLAGSLYYSPSGANASTRKAPRAFDQSLTFRHSAWTFNTGYVDISKDFSADDALKYASGSGALSADEVKALNQKKGQSGFNGGLNYDQSGNKFGMQFNTVTDSLNANRSSTQLFSVERDFSKALQVGYTHTDKGSGGLTGTLAHTDTGVLHLAFAPTRSGFLLAANQTSLTGENGTGSTDLKIDAAQKLHTLTFKSDFETVTSHCSASPNSTTSSQNYSLDGLVARSITVDSFWTTKSSDAPSSSPSDQFSTILKTSIARNLEINAQFVRQFAADQVAATHEASASYLMNRFGLLTKAQWTLAINQVFCATGAAEHGTRISMAADIPAMQGIGYWLSGAKIFLAYSGGAYTPGPGQASGTTGTFKRATRTLRLVSAPQGSRWLTWSLSQEQRVDDNGNPMPMARSASINMKLNRLLGLSWSDINQMAQPDGSYKNAREQKLQIDYNRSATNTMTADFTSGASTADNVAYHDSYLFGIDHKMSSTDNFDVALGRDLREDAGGPATAGTTCKLDYGWTGANTNAVNLGGTVTRWDNKPVATDSAKVDASANVKFSCAY